MLESAEGRQEEEEDEEENGTHEDARADVVALPYGDPRHLQQRAEPAPDEARRDQVDLVGGRQACAGCAAEENRRDDETAHLRASVRDMSRGFSEDVERERRTHHGESMLQTEDEGEEDGHRLVRGEERDVLVLDREERCVVLETMGPGEGE